MTPITIARPISQRRPHGSSEPAIRISGGTTRAAIGDNLRAGGSYANGRSELLGVTTPKANNAQSEANRASAAELRSRSSAAQPAAEETVVAPKPVPTESIEKVVRRIPTLYVIALFGVMVFCAVLMIWNTLRVNALTTEKARNLDHIAQVEQRLIKLRAEEMQLSGPSRIRDLAKTKFGMVEMSGEDLVVVR